MFHDKGILLEKELSKLINNKYYDQLPNNIKAMLKNIIRDININKPFICQQCVKGRKPDISIMHNNITKNVSLKTGSSKTIHEESIKTFIIFLRENNVSSETLKTILLFHFGDGTLNGTGEKRLCYSEIFFKLKDRIKKANEELNKNKSLVIKTAERFLFKGWGNDELIADSIYHGNINYGVSCTDRQIKYYIQKKNFSYINNIHIGPFLIYPKARYTNFKDTNPENRYKITVNWPNMQADLSYISERYD